MPRVFLNDPQDSRLAVYRDLPKSNLTRWSDRFIAEGRLVVERLLASRFPVESLLVSGRHESQLRTLDIPADVPVFLLPESEASRLTGYNFHAGWLACGRRIPPAHGVQDWASLATGPDIASSPRRIAVACPHITDPDNLGSLIRLCAAFGAEALLLGQGSADPFSRRSIRVSMGTVFSQPIIEATALRDELSQLASHGWRLAASVLDPRATPLDQYAPAPATVLLLGNEADGLSADWIAACDDSITIPMAGGTDSLNVTVAAGIILHWLRYAV
jgi:tRNA G18 (ribose-2'-O)-methylase SpoU